MRPETTKKENPTAQASIVAAFGSLRPCICASRFAASRARALGGRANTNDIWTIPSSSRSPYARRGLLGVVGCMAESTCLERGQKRVQIVATALDDACVALAAGSSALDIGERPTGNGVPNRFAFYLHKERERLVEHLLGAVCDDPVFLEVDFCAQVPAPPAHVPAGFHRTIPVH